MSSYKFDYYLILLYFFNIIVVFYYSGYLQTEDGRGSSLPHWILIMEMVVAIFQSIRILMLKNNGIGGLGVRWLHIFLYYLFSFFVGYVMDLPSPQYNELWTVFCPPIAWGYFSLVLRIYPKTQQLLTKSSFWILVTLSLLSFYIIPRAILSTGQFYSVNASYYVLLSYPMVLMDNSSVKKIIGSILMILVVFFSMKRGGIISIALGFGMYYFFVLVDNNKIWKNLFSIGILIGFIVVVLPIINEISNNTLFERYESTIFEGGDESRSEMYEKVFEVSMNSNFLNVIFGHGHNAVYLDNVLFGKQAHNDYLEFLYDYGIIGLSFFLIYQFKLFCLTKKARKKRKYFFPAIFALCCVLVLSFVSVLFAFQYFLLIIPFWCLLYEKLNREDVPKY